MTSHRLQLSMRAFFEYVREHYAIVLMGNSYAFSENVSGVLGCTSV